MPGKSTRALATGATEEEITDVLLAVSAGAMTAAATRCQL
jgi:hypothetical protein